MTGASLRDLKFAATAVNINSLKTVQRKKHGVLENKFSEQKRIPISRLHPLRKYPENKYRLSSSSIEL